MGRMRIGQRRRPGTCVRYVQSALAWSARQAMLMLVSIGCGCFRKLLAGDSGHGTGQRAAGTRRDVPRSVEFSNIYEDHVDERSLKPARRPGTLARTRIFRLPHTRG